MFRLSVKRMHLLHATAILHNDFYNFKAVIIQTRVVILRVLKLACAHSNLGADCHRYTNFVDESGIFTVFGMFWA